VGRFQGNLTSEIFLGDGSHKVDMRKKRRNGRSSEAADNGSGVLLNGEVLVLQMAVAAHKLEASMGEISEM
jgi:hypothetical protein